MSDGRTDRQTGRIATATAASYTTRAKTRTYDQTVDVKLLILKADAAMPDRRRRRNAYEVAIRRIKDESGLCKASVYKVIHVPTA